MVTYGSSSSAVVESTLTFASDILTATSSSSNLPIIRLKNTHNGATSGILKFENDKGAAGADNDVCGTITFIGDDDAETQTEFARIEGVVADASDGDECGALKLYVAENDGTNTVGLALTGSTTDGEIDVTIGAGASSVITVPGDIDLAGDIDVDGTLEADAITLGGTALGSLYSPIAGSGSIATVGTVTSGTWSGVIDGSATMTVGSDATGDVYYRDASGHLERLGASTDGYVLTTGGAGTVPAWEAVPAGGISWDGSTANGVATYKDGDEATVEANLTFDGSTLTVTGTADVSGDFTAGTVNADGDTAADDNAAMGYTAAEGLILTGQGSTSDVTIKNDADETVASIPTGTRRVVFDAGSALVPWVTTTSAAQSFNLIKIAETQDNEGILATTLDETDFSSANLVGMMKNIVTNSGGALTSDTTFWTNGGDSCDERMRILSGGGITFNGDTAAANALDDYEEGTWTGAFNCTSGSVGVDASINTGSYTKIGDVVHIRGAFAVGSVSSPSGWLTITGMPFTTHAEDTEYAYRWVGSISPWSLSGSPSGLMAVGVANDTIFYIQDNPGVNAEADHMQVGSEIRFSCTYNVS
jgi:hypothetical protein